MAMLAGPVPYRHVFVDMPCQVPKICCRCRHPCLGPICSDRIGQAGPVGLSIPSLWNVGDRLRSAQYVKVSCFVGVALIVTTAHRSHFLYSVCSGRIKRDEWTKSRLTIYQWTGPHLSLYRAEGKLFDGYVKRSYACWCWTDFVFEKKNGDFDVTLLIDAVLLKES